MALYQYVGSGDEPPTKTNFMGMYKFTLNHKYVEITDPLALSKIKNHPCFRLKEEVKKVVKKKAAKKKAKKAV